MLTAQKSHHIEAVIDRVVVREGVRDRLADSIKLAVQHSDGLMLATYDARKRPTAPSGTINFSARNTPAPTATSATRNWNRAPSASTARTVRVRRATGSESRVTFDPDLVLPDANLSLAAARLRHGGEPIPPRCGSIKITSSRSWPREACAGTRPLKAFSPKSRQQLLHGTDKSFHGVLGILEKEYATTFNEAKRQRLEAFRGEVYCKECGGTR